MSKVRVCGLWANEKDGKTYLSGSIGNAKLLVFPNGYKDKDNQPDYILYVAEGTYKKDGADPSDPTHDGLP